MAKEEAVPRPAKKSEYTLLFDSAGGQSVFIEQVHTHHPNATK